MFNRIENGNYLSNGQDNRSSNTEFFTKHMHDDNSDDLDNTVRACSNELHGCRVSRFRVTVVLNRVITEYFSIYTWTHLLSYEGLSWVLAACTNTSVVHIPSSKANGAVSPLKMFHCPLSFTCSLRFKCNS